MKTFKQFREDVQRNRESVDSVDEGIIGSVLRFIARGAKTAVKTAAKVGVAVGAAATEKGIDSAKRGLGSRNEALMYSGKPRLPQTKKPENTVKSATTSGHKTFQKRASRKIQQ